MHDCGGHGYAQVAKTKRKKQNKGASIDKRM